jgi:acetyl esterase
MPLDPQLAAMLQMMAAADVPSMAQGTPEQARAAFRVMTVDLRDPATLAPVRSVENGVAPGPAGDIAVRTYRPDVDVDGPLPTVVFFHGGGYVIGDLDTHDDHARRICADVEAVVVSADYRLAPETKFPGGLEDCLAATRWVADSVASLGGDPDRIAVAGDSAGGNLAAAVALACRSGGPRLAAQLLVYPGVDFTDGHEVHRSRIDNAEGYFLTAADMQWFAEHYLPHEQARLDPRASVLHVEDLAGLPPAVIGTAEFDPLRDEGDAYAAALEKAGVTVVHTQYPGLIHGFFGLGHASPACAEATADLCRSFRRLLA